MFSRLLSRTRPPTDDEIARELRDHLELDAEELAERGAGDDARFAAQRRFGNVSLTIEATRDEWGELRWRRLAQDLGTDIAYGIKRLRHAPGFALLTVLTTAIGVGATTAIFSVVNAVVLRPIPVADADRVVAFYETNPTNNAWTTSDPNFLDYRERARSFATMAAVAGRSAGGFAAVALLLAVIGLFGVVSFTVQERVPELGVRLAFGATPHRIVRLVMRDAGTVVAIGAVVGCVSAVLLSRFLSSMLFATATTDPPTYIAVVFVLLASAAVASYLPARRAGRVDPLVAMRER